MITNADIPGWLQAKMDVAIRCCSTVWLHQIKRRQPAIDAESRPWSAEDCLLHNSDYHAWSPIDSQYAIWNMDVRCSSVTSLIYLELDWIFAAGAADLLKP